MPKKLDPHRFLLLAVAAWMNQEQQHAIVHLREENRILRAHLGPRRLRFTDEQRRSLAAKARLLGRKLLADIATVVTPNTLLRWHRKLIANKYDGSASRRPGRPTTGTDLGALSVWHRKTARGVMNESGARSGTRVMKWRTAPLPTS